MIDKSLETYIKEMKKVAEHLVPYTFPLVEFYFEQDVLLLKQRNIYVDGHNLFVCFSKANYSEYFLESLQIQSFYTPFLPFDTVCKLGRLFLGEKNISFVEFIKNNKKIYCWTLKTKNGISLPPDDVKSYGNYEGFEYSILKSDSIDLF
jgi:hypothetical protein